MHAWSWLDICKPKTEGGVGLRGISDLNKAANLKRLWNCCKFYLGTLMQKPLFQDPHYMGCSSSPNGLFCLEGDGQSYTYSFHTHASL